jgi:hypothetical protein
MSKEIIQFNEEIIKVELKELVRSSVEETLNNLLDQRKPKTSLRQLNTGVLSHVKAIAPATTTEI